MKKFFLRGLAEGLTGNSFVMARDLQDVFAQFPVLCEVEWKLNIKDDTISGFCACDG